MNVQLWIAAIVLIALNVVILYYVLRRESKALKPLTFVVLVAISCIAIGDLVSQNLADLTLNPMLILCIIHMLSITAVIDYLTYYIYNYVLYIYVALGVAYALYLGVQPLAMIYGAISGFVMYGVIYLVAKRYYGNEAFGLGDVYFLAAIGVFLGVQQTLITGLLAFYISIFFVLFAKLKDKAMGLKSEIPFGPSIAVAAYLMVLHQRFLLDIYNGFQIFIDGLF